MKRTLLLVVLCRFAGCGLQPFVDFAACVGDDLCAGDAVGAVVPAIASNAATTTDTTLDHFTTPEITPSFFAVDPFALFLFDFDSFLLTLFDPFLDPNLLPALVDQASLDLISPLSTPSSFTYLERLCIELGEAEFICRRRYGN